MNSLALLPLPYYLCVIVLIVFAWQAWLVRDQGWGVPMLVVLGTVGAWYLCDPLYNGYKQYIDKFGAERLSEAWWEVLIFLISLRIFVPMMNRRINGTLALRGSCILQAIKSGLIDTEEFQNQITVITKLLVILWVGLMFLALLRVDFDYQGLFFPYLTDKADPWSRDRIGGGIDAVFAFANYFQSLLTALFGVCLALSKRFSTMMLAGIVYLLAVPFYIFDRTRNLMLAVLLPGFISLVTMRMKGGIVIRLAVIVVAFMALESWMKFVIDNRDLGSISEALKSGGDQSLDLKNRKHLGFNMFEELGYINLFIDKGTYQVNWGARYFAEAVNPIPRVLWQSELQFWWCSCLHFHGDDRTGGSEFWTDLWSCCGGLTYGCLGSCSGPSGLQGKRYLSYVPLCHRLGTNLQYGARYHAAGHLSLYLRVVDVECL